MNDFCIKRLLTNIYGVRLRKKRHLKKYTKKFHSNGSLAKFVLNTYMDIDWKPTKRIKF